MARLAQFKVDASAIEEGEWVCPGEEYDDLEIKTRGFTDLYYDARAARMRRLAVGFGGDAAKVPSKLQRDVTVDCLVRHCLLDVRNLADGDGNPLPFDKFVVLLRDPNYADLTKAVIQAVALVGTRQKAEAEEASGNSATPSA